MNSIPLIRSKIMNRAKWNRRPKRSLDETKDDALNKNSSENSFKVSRVRPRKRKPKHQGYTIIPAQRLWIFEK